MNNKGFQEYTGLTEKEALSLLQKNGKNCLKEDPPKSTFKIFLEQILNWTNLILAIAIIICFILKDFGEAVIILVIIIANGIIGVVQEGKAQKALDALKQMSVLKCTVIRDKLKKEIVSENLVVGDYVILEAGQQVPADLKLIECANLQVDEKALTGESVAINKSAKYIPKDSDGIGDRLDLAYMGTIVTYGRGVGIVKHTGMDTQIGQIAEMVSKEEDKKSPLQKSMDHLSKILGIICIVICAIVFGIGLLQGRPVLDMLMNSVSLAVASIPEGIPTIVAVILALGMQRMARKNAIVKTMPAVETLGAVSYVCSDKTGTLTQNKMTVVKAYVNSTIRDANDLDMDEPAHKLLLEGMMLCNDANITKDGAEIGDPTETALVRIAKKYGIEKNTYELVNPRINELPFDSDRKLMTTVHLVDDKKIISYTKGSTDELLSRCTKIFECDIVRDITQKDIHDIMENMSRMSDEALRVLSLAIRYNNKDAVEQDLIYVGMVGMIDPEREEVKASIETFKLAGIKTIMITGDHKDTAFAIAKKLGIAENKSECIMGNEIDKLSDNELREKVSGLSVFARVSPAHKVRIVKAFQDNGNVVSMTGDGVNDAPSLKAADVGVAMGITGTDVAKGAADIILQDDSFTTIETAIKEGRNIDMNNNKSILFSLSSNISEIITMFVAILVGLAAPLKAVHILWVNLLTDSVPCLALGVDTNSSYNVMANKPKHINENVFSRGRWKYIVIYGIFIALITLCGFIFAPIQELSSQGLPLTLKNISTMLNNTDILTKSQTYAFTLLAFVELFHAIGMRDVNTSIFKFKHFDNKVMILAFIIGIVGQVLVTEVPFLTKTFGTTRLSIVEWIVLLLVSMLPLVMHEILIIFKKIKG